MRRLRVIICKDDRDQGSEDTRVRVRGFPGPQQRGTGGTLNVVGIRHWDWGHPPFYAMLLGMNKNLIAASLIFAWATSLFCQTRDTDEQIKAKCEKYLQAPLPAEASAITTPKMWPECNSYKLYSGIGTKVDFAATRKCAWSERLAIQTDANIDRYSVASYLGGSAMLTVLYANGEGVPQNIPLAGRFACEAEIGHGLKEIEALPLKPGQNGKKFKFCDEAYSTPEMNICMKFSSEVASQKRTDAIRDLSSHWPKSHQVAFKSLEQAMDTFAQSHGQGETDMGGTIRAIRAIGVMERVRDKFLAALQDFESGHLPHGTASDFAKINAEMNVLYRKSVAAAETHKKSDQPYRGADIEPEGIQKAQLAWLKYRDAWVSFAKLHYPLTDSNAWLTLLTRNRAASLRMTLCGIDDKDSECTQR